MLMKRKKLLLLLALLRTAATGAWGMQIYISYPSWPTGTNVNGDGNLVLEMEASDSFENMKAKIEDKSGLNPDYMKLYFNSVEMANNETLNAKGVTSNSVLTLVYIPPYAVKLKDGTADAGNWTATVGTSTTAKPLPVGGLSNGDAVTLKYNGRLKVKAVTATHDGWNGDLSNIPASLIQDDGTVIVPDGTTLKGTLDVSTIPYKVVIPAGATVTLAGVTIIGTRENDVAHKHAGITCEGDATIILADNSENTVKGFYENYPGIYVPEESTLIIQGGSDGNGKLTASSNGFGAGIGAGSVPLSCGDIEIQGGDITATGGKYSAGIGGGLSSKCGNITISGGTVTANGGQDGAGIGSGNQYGANCVAITISGGTVKATGGHNGAGIGSGNGVSCGNITISGGTVEATATYYAAGIGSGLNGTSGNITITDGVTLVTATKGEYAPYSIGEGTTNQLGTSTCGTVTIGGTLDTDGNPVGGTVYWQNNAAVGDGATYLAQPTIEYTVVDLSTLTDNYTANHGNVLTGTREGNYNVEIADGATVTLDGVNISSSDYCIRCLGDATIVLKDGSTNTLTGTGDEYPALWAGDAGTTLTIKGSTGVLNVTSGEYIAGIGGGWSNTNSTCGNITIEGGVITARGGFAAPGIGSDNSAGCGNITITNGVTKVTAKKGYDCYYSIGAAVNGSCGTVTIGGTVYWENNAAVDNAADNYLRQATIIYPEP